MTRNIETMIAVSEILASNVVNACDGVQERLQHMSKCSQLILSRFEIFRTLLGGNNNAPR